MGLERIARVFQALQLLAIALSPSFAIWYLATFSPVPPPVFENHPFHEFAITIATLIGGFVSYVSWRSYKDSGEIFLRWLTVGFLAFTLIYAPHGFLTRTAHHNIWLFLLFGPVSRLVMLGCMAYGLAQYGKPAENVGEVLTRGFWRYVFGASAVAVAGVVVLANSSLASSPWVRLPMESAAALLCLGGVTVMVLRRITSPLMKYYGVALLLFAQAAMAFILAKPWDHMWWLAHAIFAVGFSVIGWGVVSALLTTKSFASAFSQEQLMRALEQEKELLDALNRELWAERQLARTTLDALPDHVCVIDETGTILAVNESWRDFLEANHGDLGSGGVGSNYLHACERADGPRSDGAETAAAAIRAVLQGTSDGFSMEYSCDAPGEARWFLMSVLKAQSASGLRVVIAHQNISKRKEAEIRLRHLAMIDGLTGIANRRTFDETLGQEWRRASRAGTPLALLMIDVDHFKAYNDHYGHQAGDECLKTVAATLAATAKRPADLVARYGGEEFGVILPGCTLTDAQTLAEKMRLAVAELHLPHLASQTSGEVTISIGVSCLNLVATQGDSLDTQSLIAEADTALYRAKTSGRNCVSAQPAP
ncbi:GGDEF domain-contatining protein [Paramagnetospirillum magnetotacticum MS-1]|uniref:diguanylate cyclase n=1 Tax=Paramagnetospirillum magnetotacticum MS-1 TaxID=272627 RepID=A0A0C2YHP3_PARME|nr:sensor domain-containing diguanylate cyclase [Paramagnetospirillum magnetotacticum]KIL99259.1 GGDEF domain-contatining protein [Paramagnetospirillum magnetotacticum MS-1]